MITISSFMFTFDIQWCIYVIAIMNERQASTGLFAARKQFEEIQ